MIMRIIDSMVEAYKGYDGLDELQRGFKLAIAVSGMDFTEEERKYMFNEILYRLRKEV